MNTTPKAIYEVERGPLGHWRISEWQVIRETAKSWIVDAPYYEAGKRVAKTTGLDDRPVENVFFDRAVAQAYLRRQIYDAVGELIWQLPQGDELRRAVGGIV